MGWKMVVAVRCTRCDVFVPSDELAYTAAGDAYCSSCDAPAPPRRRPSTLVITAAGVAAVVASFFMAACASQL